MSTQLTGNFPRNREYPLYLSDVIVELVNRLCEEFEKEMLVSSESVEAHPEAHPISERPDATELWVIKRMSFPHDTLTIEFKVTVRRNILHRTPTYIRRGDPKEILNWFSMMPEDEEFANLLDDIIEKMRRELKLA